MEPSSVEGFVATARAFCTLAEGTGEVTAADLRHVRELLIQLMFHMPSVEAAPNSAEHDADRLDSEALSQVASRFGGFSFNVYSMVFDPHDIDGSDGPVMGALSDDLSDIYGDLAQGLSGWDAGHRESACFDWSLSYRTHWAQHATAALRAIETHRLER